MALTYLDSVMIENPAYFLQLSAAQLSADLFNSQTIDNTGNIFTVGLSVQSLTADRLVFGPEEYIANTLYVSVSGDDNNSGRTIFEPLRTIKKACEISHNTLNETPGATFTIFVGTGNYTEENPIFVPKNTTLIGDNLRRTTIRPLSTDYDILWCNNSVYVWGFTFRGHKNGAAATAYPDFSNPTLTDIALRNLTVPTSSYNMVFPGVSQGAGWKKPYILTSPYIQGCSSITNATGAVSAGCGMRIDGSLAEGFLRSFVLDSFTQFNEGGKGIHIINNGYAQLVSIFTICCTEGIHAESGGSCSINTSNCSFGLSGIVATGKSPQPILSACLVEDPVGTSQIRISQNTTQGLTLYPDSIAPTIANAPYNGLVFTIGNNPTIHVIEGNPALSSTNDGPDYIVDTVDRIETSHLSGSIVNFYIRSTVTTSSHTFEYIGSGVTLASAVPALGGVGDFAKEAVFSDGGVVYFTSTNQAGNFRVGNEFTILQETGTIEGDTFKRAILALVTPLVLSLE
jgi:hypothetical protein